MELPAGWFVGSCYEGHLNFVARCGARCGNQIASID
jgi:hypothetical protein